VLRSGEVPRRSGVSNVEIAARIGIAYPEWDYRTSRYRPHAAIVRQPTAKSGDAEWVAAVVSRHGRLIRNVRSRFERLRPRPVRVYGQTDGPELDTAAYVRAAADQRARVATDGRLYVAMQRERRELAVALLVDVSASTDAWVSANRRIVDVEKEAMLVMCCSKSSRPFRDAPFPNPQPSRSQPPRTIRTGCVKVRRRT
jgi:nitric oxide reductase NorD protein